MGILANENAISSGGYTVSKSLRFRASASGYLSRTPASAGNRKTYTYSIWFKRGRLGVNNAIFSCNNGLSDSLLNTFYFNTSDVLVIGGYNTNWRVTSQVFRDPSAWYHIVVVMDTTQATGANRVKLYVNGTQVTAFSTSNDPTLNFDTAINQAAIHYISTYNGAADFIDGYAAEINFIDGQALTPSSFGSTNPTTGVWQPAKYTGTYGTNGFYLPFTNTSTTSTLVADSSGNGNNWTPNNISLTAGVTYDSMIDSPTLGATGTQPVGNYSVLNPLSAIAVKPTNGNLTFTGGSGAVNENTIGIPTSGKYYAEIAITSVPVSGNDQAIGLNPIGSTGTGPARAYSSNGQYYNGSAWVSFGGAWSQNDIIGVAVDADNNQLSFYKNNVQQGTTQSYTVAGSSIIIRQHPTTSGTYEANFGQRPFTYTPPTGFKALCTTNLPDSTIVKGSVNMNAVLQVGSAVNTGANLFAQSGYTYGMAWGKDRAAVNNHQLVDTVRGTSAVLQSNTTAAETTYTAPTSGDSCVAWVWNAGNASASNTSGTITSTVSVNATAGFSVVTYTGTGANATVGHGLGVAPKMVIVKNRSSAIGWQVRHASIPATQTIELQDTAAAYVSAVWNNTAPTSTVFSLGTGLSINNSGQTYVAYCFAEISGYSKAFSYTGNGSADGVFSYLGFAPKLILLKRTDTTGNWIMWDTVRNTYNVLGAELYPNLLNAEASATDLDVLSNGFKIRNTTAAFNASGGTYIGFAWASNPFKNSLAF